MKSKDFQVIKEFLKREVEIISVCEVISSKFIINVKGRVKRQLVHDIAAKHLQQAVNQSSIKIIREALRRMGVIPVVSRGFLYYRGISIREESDFRCCSCHCH